MKIRLNVKINKQPDYTTCGPTSLHAVYSHYGDSISLEKTIEEINQFDEGGGTLAAILGKHANNRGYRTTLISYNVRVFDPSWFGKDNDFIKKKLQHCISEGDHSDKHLFALNQYVEYLESGGNLRFEDLSPALMRKVIDSGVPILTGLSSTWLYRDKRENPVTNEYDDLNGKPAGHFVIIDGYDDDGKFSICDPYHKNPFNQSNQYEIDGHRLINSILLGISSYDGNFLLIENKE